MDTAGVKLSRVNTNWDELTLPSGKWILAWGLRSEGAGGNDNWQGLLWGERISMRLI